MFAHRGLEQLPSPSYLLFRDLLARPFARYRAGEEIPVKNAKGQSVKILYGEGDVEHMAHHAGALVEAGHHVEKAVGRQGVLNALGKGTFDLVILGPTLSKDDRHHLPYMVKKANEKTRVLVLHGSAHRHHEVDAAMDEPREVHPILDIIARLTSQPV